VAAWNALEVEGLGKAYRVYRGPLPRIIEGLTFGKRRGHHEFWALRDVSFSLKPGGSMGLCGANGAGKSTLLKVLAGTTSPTTGRFRAQGRVASLLELGAGFHLDFTGRANIVVNAIMMGLSRREVDAKMDEIIEFAELGAYIDEPVRTYSSGMGLRLGFSIALAVDPEVMIIDEVFAVGDMYFQKKCVDRIYDLKRNNKTILFCSHSLYDVRQLCDEAIWLDEGKVMSQGESVRVTNDYTSFQRLHIEQAAENLEQQFGADGGKEGVRPRDFPHILDARLYRLGTDEEVYEVETGDSLELRIWWRNPGWPETHMNVAVGFVRQDQTTCGGMATNLDECMPQGKEGCTILRIPDLKLFSGQFLVPVILLDETGVHKYQQMMLPENLVVRTNTREIGLFKIDHAWETRTDVERPEPVESTPAPEGAT
jgi:ABC-type polysaccharide/polyol phosphate transport system ATPase subunit